MALNSVMLSKLLQPVPLPQEKTLLFIHNVTATLHKMAPGSTSEFDKDSKPITSAGGTVFISNQRVVYVGKDAGSLQGTENGFKTLSVNLRNYLDGRLIQPWLGGMHAQ